MRLIDRREKMVLNGSEYELTCYGTERISDGVVSECVQTMLISERTERISLILSAIQI